MRTLKVTEKELNNDNGNGGLEISIPGATGNPEDGNLNCPIFIEYYHGELRVVIWDGSPDPTIVPIKNFKPNEGSTIKPVAICGLCGKNDKEGTGEGGFCKHCGGDHWVELQDLQDADLIPYVNSAATTLNMTKEELGAELTKLNNP